MNLREFSKARKICCSVFLALTAVWLAFICWNSLQNGEASDKQSRQVTEWINAVLRAVGFSDEISGGLVRRLGHFGEFFVLAVLYILDLIGFGVIRFDRSVRRIVGFACTAVPVCFAVGTADEQIQRLSDGRACEFSDVLTDTAGGATAAVFALAVLLLIRLWRYKNIKTEP